MIGDVFAPNNLVVAFAFGVASAQAELILTASASLVRIRAGMFESPETADALCHRLPPMQRKRIRPWWKEVQNPDVCRVKSRFQDAIWSKWRAQVKEILPSRNQTRKRRIFITLNLTRYVPEDETEIGGYSGVPNILYQKYKNFGNINACFIAKTREKPMLRGKFTVPGLRNRPDTSRKISFRTSNVTFSGS